MKAICLKRPGTVVCTERPVPVPGPGEARIRVMAAGICGSDIGAFRGTNPLVSYPRIIGHELAGIIEAIGPTDRPCGFSVGDEVIVDPYLFCGKCYPCRLGRTNCCTDLKVLGVHTDGGMAEVFCHPVRQLIRKPAGMSWTLAAMAEPLTIALRGVHRGRLAAGEVCAIYGAGTIGLLAALTARAYGAVPVLMDIVQERLDFAASLGIEHTVNTAAEDPAERIAELTDGQMAPLVMECTGAGPCIRSCLDLVSHAGRITLTGWPKGETLLPTDVITRKEIDVLGARNSAGEFEEAISLIHSGQVDVGRILTKTVPLEAVPDVIRDIDRHPERYLKVVADLS